MVCGLVGLDGTAGLGGGGGGGLARAGGFAARDDGAADFDGAGLVRGGGGAERADWTAGFDGAGCAGADRAESGAARGVRLAGAAPFCAGCSCLRCIAPRVARDLGVCALSVDRWCPNESQMLGSRR